MTENETPPQVDEKQREIAVQIALRTGLLRKCPHHGEVYDPGQHDYQGACMVAAFLIITLASIGMPALNGFIGEFLTMLGAFLWDPRFVVVAGLGVILSAVYMLWMFQRVYLGTVTHEENETLPDLKPREWASVFPLCAMAIVMGVFPTLFLTPMEPAVQRLVAQVQSVQPLRVENGEGQGSKVKGQKLSPRIEVTGSASQVRGILPSTLDLDLKR